MEVVNSSSSVDSHYKNRLDMEQGGTVVGFIYIFDDCLWFHSSAVN